MEKPIYPSPYIRITQKHGIGTHFDSYAFDEAGSDGGIDYLIASFTGIIRKIYTADANEVWLESIEPVEYPDGTIDYMTLMLAHDNNVSNLKVGQVIKQGQRFYEEGTKGNASGNHVHIECSRGKFTGTGWHQNSAGYWSINNGKKADECLWVDDSYHILDTAGYKFRNVKDAEPKKLGTPIERNENVDQVRVFDETTVLRARNNPNGDVLGYMNSGIYNLLERASDGDYEWFKVEESLWFAYSTDWCELLPKKETPVEPEVTEPTIEELTKKIEELNKIIDEQNDELIEMEIELRDAIEKLEEQPILAFTSPKTDYYAIKLEENRRLYIDRAE